MTAARYLSRGFATAAEPNNAVMKSRRVASCIMGVSAIMMQMQIRQANEPDYPAIEKMVIESFEPITWFRTIDAKYGPLNGADWRARWQLRMQDVFESQIVLMGEVDGVLAAMSSGTFDAQAALAYIDLLAVSLHRAGTRIRPGNAESHDETHAGDGSPIRVSRLSDRKRQRERAL
jgi:hypothetical protein